MSKQLITLIIIIGLFSQGLKQACWKNSYGRGVGSPLSRCPNNLQKDGALCYPKCRSGFKGVGPICWQSCPNNFRDDGAFCAKPKPYGRGGGYALWDKKKCKRRNKQGCEKHGLLYYPKCRAGYHAAGCCICSPNCINGQTDIGVSCAKQSYGRGAGKPLICAPNTQQNGLLCYDKCRQDYEGEGPVCWKKCPKDTIECGLLCVQSQGECTRQIATITGAAIVATAGIGAMLLNPPGTAALVTAYLGATGGVISLGSTLLQEDCPANAEV